MLPHHHSSFLLIDTFGAVDKFKALVPVCEHIARYLGVSGPLHLRRGQLLNGVLPTRFH